jgi:hypothetical protein
MASQYTGNPTATQAPSPAPSFNADPIGNLPADGDTLNASSVAQAFKVPLDWIAFLRRILGKYMGVTEWDANMTYFEGQMVWYGTNGNTYMATTTVSGTAPTDETKWSRWAFTKVQLLDALMNELFSVIGDTTAGYITLPGQFAVHWEYLEGNPTPLPSTPGAYVDHTFDSPFSSNCFGAWFSPKALSVSHSVGMPSLLISNVTKTGCRLFLVDQGASADGAVASGVLFSIGN